MKKTNSMIQLTEKTKALEGAMSWLSHENKKAIVKNFREVNDGLILDHKRDVQSMRDRMKDRKSKKEAKEALNKIPRLKQQNFKVEDTKDRLSLGWSGSDEIKINREQDICQIDWQHFFLTQEAAIRETEKAGQKILPSIDYLNNIENKKYKWDYQKFLIWENISFSGVYRKRMGIESVNKTRGHEVGLRTADTSVKHVDFTRHSRYAEERWDEQGVGLLVRCIEE